MAKEVIQGEVVDVSDDDSPEEGEIEDDISEEEIIEKNEFRPSNTTDVNITAGGLKHYQPPCSSKTEIRNGKSKVYSEDRKDMWRSSSRRHFKFYIDHDKPTRDPYDRSVKSDLTYDHRGINFQDLLKDYRTSKHGNEGNSHEKENRHYAKEVSVDSLRRRDCGLNDTQEDKIKKNRKRKHRSPSPSPVSSDSDVLRKRKDSKAVKHKKKKKLTVSMRNLNESAALFAQIRAKRNLEIAAEQQKSQVEVINVPSEGENVTEECDKCIPIVRSVVSEGDDPKSDDTRTNVAGEFLLKDSSKMDSKSLCSASDSQNAEKVEDSESKDEDDDENQLRMIALQSAFRAKFLERKRRGFIVKRQTTRTVPHISPKGSTSDAGFNLDDTADLLEAAVEEAVACTNKESSDFPEDWQPILATSLSEVPLPPDDPPLRSPVEDLTPVDMELALTDEEENTDSCQLDDDGFPTEKLEHTKVRVSHLSSKTRQIPVTIGGQTQPSKSRQRIGSCVENSQRTNLLEVRTCSSDGLSFEDMDSCLAGMEGVDMGSMIVLDAVGTCSSPEAIPGTEDEVLSEASDVKGDFTQPESNAASEQVVAPENEIDDEDEELLRARLLLDISSRHRSESTATNPLKPDVSLYSGGNQTSVQEHGSAVNATSLGIKASLKMNGKNSPARVADLQSVKAKALSRRNIERARREQLLAKVRGRQMGVANNGQVAVSPFMKSYLSKISNRGKFQRVNQNRTVTGTKGIDGNLQVTVVGSADKTMVVSKLPQQQDRIVICLGEDSDESEDEKHKILTKTDPVLNKASHLKQASESASPAGAVVVQKNVSNAPAKSMQVPPAPSISIDFEKSVDLFLKEVRSGQESKSKAQTTLKGSQVKKTFSTPKQTTPVLRVAGNGLKAKPAKVVAKSASGVTPQAVRHLPALQQEEYRRLKMQISVLEEKKRRAAEISKDSSKDGNVAAVKPKDVQSTPSIAAKTENLTDSSNLPKEKCDTKVSTEEVPALKDAIDSGKDGKRDDALEDDEDVNLLREQLLKSTLRKKIAAKLEIMSLKQEVKTVEKVPLGSNCASNSEEVSCESETTTSKKFVVSSKAETQPSTPAIVPTDEEKNLGMDKVEVSRKVSSDVQQLPPKSSLESKKIVSLPNKDVHPNKNEVDLSVKRDPPEEMEDNVTKKGESPKGQETVSSKCLNATESIHCGADSSESNVELHAPLSKNVTSESGSNSLLNISRETHQNQGKETIKAGDSKNSTSVAVRNIGVQSSASALRTIDAATNVAAVIQESHETRASELMELEYKLLSERHAALKYLSELSNLLTKMEIEGARLRQKEIAVQKLRAELAAAETSIVTQKDYLKQLAKNISSTHEKVSTTRQRCYVLSHACTMLGNQIKKDKRANGGQDVSGYCVPTGGAALVKSQLSSVHVKTKQLKKAGLPFLRGQTFNTRVKYPIQKVPGKSHGQSSAMPGTQSLEPLNLVEKPKPVVVPASVGIPEKLSGNISNVPAPKSTLVLKSTSKSKTDGLQSLTVAHAGKTTPVSRSVTTPGKFVHPSSSTLPAHTASSSSTSNSCAKVEVPAVSINKIVSKVCENVVKTVPVNLSSLSKDPECPCAQSPGNVSSVKQVVTSGVEKPATSCESVVLESMPLKDYRSPLEPISARLHTEDLAVTSESSMLLEDSVMLDPNIILCPYDLNGVCQDEECTYQHQRRKGVVKES